MTLDICSIETELKSLTPRMNSIVSLELGENRGNFRSVVLTETLVNDQCFGKESYGEVMTFHPASYMYFRSTPSMHKPEIAQFGRN